MEFWGPVLLLMACTGLAAAFGVRSAIAGALGFLIAFIWAASSLGGTRDSGSFVMVAGFFAVPIAIGTGIAVVLGRGLRQIFGGKSLIQAASKELMAAPVAESFEEASAVAAEHFRSGSRIRVRCPNCQKTLDARRVLSSSRLEPDIEVTCRCGACSHVFPFRQSAV